ncbi:MAG: non-hydrolyzing UDP-N-acetylglucosamine 2-epimerase [Candidatus Thorarchaeota archaeon]
MFVALITGTRPQIVKSAPVLKALETAGVEFEFIHTGQHYDYEMAGAFVEEFELIPPIGLGVGEGTPCAQISKIIEPICTHFGKRRPDYVIVPGDTTSALGAALACFKMDIPVCHLESGLRIYDFSLQEELNRRLIDHGAAALFAPTDVAVQNLNAEQVLGCVYQIGDTMYDILKTRLPRLSKASFRGEVRRSLNIEQYLEYAVLTLHRRENVDDRQVLANIVSALNSLEFDILFPIHPRTRSRLIEFGIELDQSHIRIIDPLTYDRFISLVADSKLVISDSGGIQKECYLLNVPLVTLRKRTEWIETIHAGANILSTLETQDVVDKCENMFAKKMKNSPDVYGDGNAAVKIPNILKSGEVEIPRDTNAKLYSKLLK